MISQKTARILVAEFAGTMILLATVIGSGIMAERLAGPFAVMPLLGRPVDILPAASGMILPVAGFIVGIGTAVGSGCTSGHGICGLARLSPRSLTAVCTFMATGIATVFLVRHVL